MTNPSEGRFLNRGPSGPRCNHQIRAQEVRVLNEHGDQLGVMAINKAMRFARDAGLDLVEIAAAAQPPVCKIIERGRYLYELNKRQADNRKPTPKTKEIQISANIDPHDLETKARHAKEFLEAGDTVRVSMRLRGRENAHVGIAINQFQNLGKTIGDAGHFQLTPKVNGKNIFATLVPGPAHKRPVQTNPSTHSSAPPVTKLAAVPSARQPEPAH